MHPMLNIAIQAARHASKSLVRFIDSLSSLDSTSNARADFTTKMHRLSEREMIYVIEKSYPEHCIKSQYNETGNNASNHCWLIEPLDGTNNFMHGLPHFAMSIAVAIDDAIEVAVIYDPLRDELFTAALGKGAQLNNRRIRVSGRKTMAESLLTTSVAIDECGGIRQSGTTSLDLAYVAAGRLDGFCHSNTSTYSRAAGTLLVAEAGGIVSDFTGRKNYHSNNTLICATPRIHLSLLEQIQTNNSRQ